MKKQLHKIKIAAENFSQRFVLVFFSSLSFHLSIRVVQKIILQALCSRYYVIWLSMTSQWIIYAWNWLCCVPISGMIMCEIHKFGHGIPSIWCRNIFVYMGISISLDVRRILFLPWNYFRTLTFFSMPCNFICCLARALSLQNSYSTISHK